MKLFMYTALLPAMICMVYAIHAEIVNIDEFFERTVYDQLLNELICMTDTIALLEHPKTDMHDKRFIEDSILGKILRAYTHIEELPVQELTAHDIAYAQSWIELAQRSTSQPFLLRELDRFARRLQERLKMATHLEMVAHQ